MIIELKKFGTILTSRQMGKEAVAAFRPNLVKIKKDETVEIDFAGVNVLSPSWADEFLTPLVEERSDKIILKNTNNSSVQATLKILEDVHGYKLQEQNI